MVAPCGSAVMGQGVRFREVYARRHAVSSLIPSQTAACSVPGVLPEQGLDQA